MPSGNATRTNEGGLWGGVEAMARAKRERRLRLAALPFERKIEILRKLQETAAEIRESSALPAGGKRRSAPHRA